MDNDDNKLNKEDEKLKEEILEEIEEQKIEDMQEQIEIAETIEFSKSGKAIIDLCINDADDFYSPYCSKNYKLLKPEVEEYIASYTTNVPIVDDYEFIIRSKEELSAVDKERITKTIKRTYAEKIADVNVELKKNLLQSIIFMFVGLVFMVMYLVLLKFDVDVVYTYILDLVAWVFLWESVDVFFMKRFTYKRQRAKFKKILMADFTFKKEN